MSTPVQLLRDSVGPNDPGTGKPLWTCQTWPRADGGGSVYACIPNFLEVLGDFKSLQRAINDYVAKHNLGPPIRVDGQIGEPETWAAYQVVANHMKLSNVAGSVDELAGRAGEMAKLIATAAGAGINTTPDPVPQRPRETEAPTVDPTKSGGSRWWLWALIGVGVVTIGGVTWYMMAKGKKKKGKSHSTRPALALSGGFEDESDDDSDDELDGDSEDNYHPLFGKVIDV